ncbi:hypothetical protein [Faecalibacterium prausnitzii]|uniref:hypothetical protein n=1 Tax=Faecalibacterium prausnitzii TaxID=853 RepID=UPI0032C0F054
MATIINESTARLAKQMRSFDDYKEGSATASYNAQCAEAAAILEKAKAKCATDEQRERAEYLYNRYCSVLAEAINRDNEIGTRCPSVLICGAGNFPTRKKEKQIAAWDKNMENWRKADHYLDMLKRAHTLAVKSDDPEVLDFLRAKLAGLEEAHALMVSANAYYRKNKTLEGFEGIPADTMAWITRPGVYLPGGRNGDGSPLAFYGKPFPTYELTNSNANIKRVKQRIETLEAVKASKSIEEEHDGYTYRENAEAMRVQLRFDGKPDDETRALLKRNGFRWAPSQGVWQRQLNDNGKYAAHRVMEVLDGQQ